MERDLMLFSKAGFLATVSGLRLGGGASSSSESSSSCWVVISFVFDEKSVFDLPSSDCPYLVSVRAVSL